MTRRRRSRLFQAEALEGRMLLSAAVSRITSVPVLLNFAVPGTEGRYVIWGPAVYSGVVHALASQEAGSVTLKLQSGTPPRRRDSVQVDISTGPITDPDSTVSSAEPGVQYQPSHQIVTFPPGVRSVQVTIPIIPGANDSGLVGFQVTATQLGATSTTEWIGQATQQVFVAQNAEPSGPRIDGASMVVNGRRTSEIRLHFNRPMDAATVENVNAYNIQDSTFHTHPMSIFGAWGPNISSASTRLKKAVYDPSTNTVSLRLAKSVDSRDGLQVQQTALLTTKFRSTKTESPILRDTSGTPINEDGSGLGGAFLVTLTSKQAKAVDGVSETVVPPIPPRP